MERKIKTYHQFINESTKEVVYPTNFKGMVQSALGGLYTSIMAIARELANEKAEKFEGETTKTLLKLMFGDKV